MKIRQVVFELSFPRTDILFSMKLLSSHILCGGEESKRLDCVSTLNEILSYKICHLCKIEKNQNGFWILYLKTCNITNLAIINTVKLPKNIQIFFSWNNKLNDNYILPQINLCFYNLALGWCIKPFLMFNAKSKKLNFLSFFLKMVKFNIIMLQSR